MGKNALKEKSFGDHKIIHNGIEATRLIRKDNSHSKIITLTQYEENEYVVRFLKAGGGGDGYLLKNSKKDRGREK